MDELTGFFPTFLLSLIDLAIVVTGPGRYSLDARLFGSRAAPR